MELSKLKVEKRNKLYFNKFKYKAVTNIQGAAYTNYTTDIETFVSRMEKLRNNTNKYGVRIINEDWKEYWEEVNLDRISQLITWRTIISKDRCLIRIENDTVTFFSNELPLLQTLDSIDDNVKIYEAICYDSDCLYFKKTPNYKYRTYFKARRMPKDFSDNVKSLHTTYKSLHFSKALFKTLFDKTYHPYRYLHGSYFVEYDDETMLTILSMWFPGMISKTYSCHKQP